MIYILSCVNFISEMSILGLHCRASTLSLTVDRQRVNAFIAAISKRK